MHMMSVLAFESDLAGQLPGPPHVLLFLHRDDVAFVEGEMVVFLSSPRIQGLSLQAFRGTQAL